MKQNLLRTVIPAMAALFSLASVGLAGEVSAEADSILKAMSKKLAAAQSFTVDAKRSISNELAEIHHSPKDAEISASVSRPNRLAGKSIHGKDERHLRFDGKAATIFEASHKVYAVVPLEGSIDNLVDHLEHMIGIEPPLSDFIVADPYTSLLSGKPTGKVVGEEKVCGMDCKHLSFAQEGIEWEVWVGGDSLPHRFVIRFLEEGGADLSVKLDEISWNLGAKIEDSAFSFTPPEGVQKIEIANPEELAEKK